jgi:hypothetical protein
VAHIVAAGSWIGVDLVLGVLVFAPGLVEDPSLAGAGYRVLPVLFWPMIGSGTAALVTGVALGLATHWGLVRYRWVALKLAITVLLLVLVALALRPGLEQAAEQGRRLESGEPVTTGPGSLAFPPIVSASLLLVAVALSVVKPRTPVRGRAHRIRSQFDQPGRTSPLS